MKSLTAVCFMLGLAMAGSDGVWFPWVNVAGVLVFTAVYPLSRRIEP
jgi:hypothetical protein